MQYEHSTALGSSNLKIWLYLFDYMFWSWWPLCPVSCKLVQNASDASVRGSMATLVATQMQPEHSTTLYIFNPRFGLSSFDYVFWSWCPLCPQSCKLVQSDANTPARRGGDTLAASQVQPEHCPNLDVFILKFWLCSFDGMFWS